MTGTVGDFVAVGVAALVIVYLLVLCGGLLRHRNSLVLKTQSATYMVLMCVAACVHISAAVVTHGHFDFLDALEQSSCVVWGYWLPYTSAGVWFTFLYLKLLSYIAPFSRSVTDDGVRFFAALRPGLAVITMLPPIVINTVVTAIPDVSGVDEDTGACTSIFGAKIAVSAWVTVCIFLIAGTLLWYKRHANDPLGQFPRQWVILAITATATIAQAVIIVFSGSALGDAIGRFGATISLVAMYALIMGILAHRPVWKATRRHASYTAMMEGVIMSQQRPIQDIMELVDNPKIPVSSTVRTIVADFIVFCSEQTAKMDRGGVFPTSGKLLVAIWMQADHWTTSHKDYDPPRDDHGTALYGRYNDDAFPPLFSSGINYSASQICATWFAPPYGKRDHTNEYDGDAHLPHTIMRRCARNAGAREPPVDTFRDLLWYLLRELSTYYGHDYMNRAVHNRDIWATIAPHIVEFRTLNSQGRLMEIGIDVDGDSSQHTAAVPVVTDRPVSNNPFASSSDSDSDTDGVVDGGDDNDGTDNDTVSPRPPSD